MLRNPTFSFILILFVSFSARSETALSVAKRADELFRGDSSRARIRMTIQTPNWSRSLLIDSWSKGMDETFIRILEPKKEKGTATLRVKEKMWNFFPKVNKVVKVPPSMMMGSWMGSDFTNDDLVRESSFVEDYSVSFGPANAADKAHYIIDLIPKEDTPSVWSRIEMKITTKGLIPIHYRYFDDDNSLAREMTFGDAKIFGKRKIPTLLTMRTLNKEGHSTIIRYEKIEFNLPLKKDLFTLRNLKNPG